MKNTVRECSQFIQNKEQNVNYSVLYRNYLFDTRRVIVCSVKAYRYYKKFVVCFKTSSNMDIQQKGCNKKHEKDLPFS